jgi:hypothetical protein
VVQEVELLKDRLVTYRSSNEKTVIDVLCVGLGDTLYNVIHARNMWGIEAASGLKIEEVWC